MNSLHLILYGLIIFYISFWITKLQRQYRAKEFGNIVKVISNRDGQKYEVQDLPAQDEAADMMADLNEWIDKLVNELKNNFPNKRNVKRLVANYNPNAVIEGDPLNKDNYTSYSINKGQILVFCIRSKGKI